mmetsp:Transcript_68143/g.142352  ORF Transcript_68143/g.142352 Transcript_68143/m.142352 type:complete len:143 (+) Transcript_68143:187-615(+)
MPPMPPVHARSQSSHELPDCLPIRGSKISSQLPKASTEQMSEFWESNLKSWLESWAGCEENEEEDAMRGVDGRVEEACRDHHIIIIRRRPACIGRAYDSADRAVSKTDCKETRGRPSTLSAFFVALQRPRPRDRKIYRSTAF